MAMITDGWLALRCQIVHPLTVARLVLHPSFIKTKASWASPIRHAACSDVIPRESYKSRLIFDKTPAFCLKTGPYILKILSHAPFEIAFSKFFVSSSGWRASVFANDEARLRFLSECFDPIFPSAEDSSVTSSDSESEKWSISRFRFRETWLFRADCSLAWFGQVRHWSARVEDDIIIGSGASVESLSGLSGGLIGLASYV